MDILQLFKYLYDKVDPFYRSVFIKIFLATNIVYLYYTANFLFSDHDISFLTNRVDYKSIWWAGRFFQYVPIQIVGGYILPVINNLLTFSAHIIAGIMVCSVWMLPKREGLYFLAVSFLLFVPYSMTWMFYVQGSFAMFLIPLYVAAAAILARSDTWHSLLAGAILLFFAVSTYHPAINTICIIFGGKLILDVADDSAFTNSFGYYKRLFIMSLLGGGIFCASFMYLKHNFIIDSFYAIEINGVFDIILNIPKMLLYGVKQFFIDQPYIEKPYKSVLFFALVFSFFAIITRCLQNNKKQIPIKLFAVVFLFAGIIFATQLSNLISSVDTFLFPRIALYGLVFLSLFSLVVLCSSRIKIFNNLGVGILVVLLGVNIVQVARIQKSWGESAKIESDRISRLIYSIETHPSFDNSVTYTVYSCGSFDQPRRNFYPKPFHEHSDELHSQSIITYWDLSIVLGYKEPNLKLSYGGRSVEDLAAFLKKLELPQRERYRTVIHNARSWPSQQSVVILDSIMLLFLDRESLASLATLWDNNCGTSE